MIRDRTAFSLVLAGVLVLLVGLLRPASEVTGMKPDVFWAEKVRWTARFDVVLAGDSRVYRGLSPAAVNEELPGLRVGNFGFSGCGFEAEYLGAVEGLLDPESKAKTIVLGVTPHSLTPKALKGNGFLERRGGSLRKLHEARGESRRKAASEVPHLGDFVYLFRPLEWSSWAVIRGKKKEFYFQKYHPDGWVAGRRDPEEPRMALRSYRKLFQDNRTDERIVEKFVQTVKKWTAHGIRVYAFRPPTTLAMVALESELSGFDEAGFIRKFQNAGGVWFDFPADAYRSYDGSHLRGDAAREFSKDLARAMKSAGAGE